MSVDRGEGMWVGQMGRGVHRVGIATLLLVLPGLIAGCHEKKLSDLELSRPSMQTNAADLAGASAKKVGGAGAAVVSACKIETYANASKGLVVSETGLREDVLDLRDRISYKGVPFDLQETERLEALLRKEIDVPRITNYSADQAECIRQFADHMQTLIEPLVEADAEQKQLDVSAFDNASKEAQQEIEQEEKAMQQAAGH
jgi:hypothetical protein